MKINFAIIGCGRVAKKHLEVYNNNFSKNLNLVAVCDKRRYLAEKLINEKNKKIKIYKNCKEMFKNEKIDCHYQVGDVLNRIQGFNLDITDQRQILGKNSIDSPESLIQTVGIPGKTSFSEDEINLGAMLTIRYLNSLINPKSPYTIKYIKGKGKTFSVAISARGKKLNRWNCKVGTERRVTMVKCRS